MVIGGSYSPKCAISLTCSVQGNQGDAWINAKIDIPPTNNHYDFIFQGVVVCASRVDLVPFKLLFI